ncbi:hypothetical protein WJX84_007693 [Apatococcus fuscideae]|uniref:Uncharacterized protein n=1 Tax=Apatococcus fuscideae TaxID=2026836 RepID=A0AAW1TAT2_9CHLO
MAARESRSRDVWRALNRGAKLQVGGVQRGLRRIMTRFASSLRGSGQATQLQRLRQEVGSRTTTGLSSCAGEDDNVSTRDSGGACPA